MAGRKKKRPSFAAGLKYELYGIVILTLSVLVWSQTGAVPRSITYLLRFCVGVGDWMIPLAAVAVGLYAMIHRGWPKFRTPRKIGLLLFALAFLLENHIRLFAWLDPGRERLSAAFILGETWRVMTDGLTQPDGILRGEVGGGIIGAVLYAALYTLFDQPGAQLIVYMFVAIGVVLVFRVSYVEAVAAVRRRLLAWRKKAAAQRVRRADVSEGRESAEERPAPSGSVTSADDWDEWISGWETAKKEDVKGEAAKTEKTSEAAADLPIFRDFQQHAGVLRLPYDEADHADSGAIRRFSSTAAVSEAAHRIDRDRLLAGFASGKPATIRVRVLPQEEGSSDSDGGFEVGKAEGANPAYELPPLELLQPPVVSGRSAQPTDYAAMSKKLEETLESFGVKAKVLEVVRGPAVTRFELQPAVGVKVSRIVNLTDDIALALAAKDIRMEAPIPGKSAIGIEVPNNEISVVTLREVIESPAFQESPSKLTVALGRDISGQAVIANLARMPHLLVAGATGSGKSVCINGMIVSMLYKARPDEVRFLMIDPKMVEMNVYNGIPHLLAPVVTDPKRAAMALKKIVVEMEKRYEIFSKSGTRNIEGYNQWLRETGEGEPLPYIVVIVDELADLMMVAAGDVEDSICRLAQMARAAGIHLILATQRPSVDVITGVIKANIPSRIAFGVSSQVDSRTILDMAGAEKLLGRGDMLFLPMGSSKPVRIQGAFVSEREVEEVVAFVRGQARGDVRYEEGIVPETAESEETAAEVDDELYDRAVRIVLESRQASVSLLQRRLRIGYARAARLIDAMEAGGIVGPYEGTKPREVRMTLEEWVQRR